MTRARLLPTALLVVVLAASAAGAAGVLPHDIDRVSVTSGGDEVPDPSSAPAVSGDGTRIVFASLGRLHPLDERSGSDIYLHDTAAGTTTLVSVSSGGIQGNRESYRPTISGDGNRIAFESWADNLVPGDTNEAPDVFVHDTTTGTTVRVSVASGGSQGSGWSTAPSLSADGSRVAFHSSSPELVAGDTNGAYDVFLHDLSTGETTRVSVTGTGGQGDGHSQAPSLSADGTRVAFVSRAANLVDGDGNGVQDVFVRDLTAGTTARVSVATGGTEADRASESPALSGDGRLVAFNSTAGNLMPGDENAQSDVFLRDLWAATTVQVSRSWDGLAADGGSFAPRLDHAGTAVAFVSGATNLIRRDTTNNADVFVYHVATGLTTRVSVGSDRQSPTASAGGLALSADGATIVFDSPAGTLVPGDTNGYNDVFRTGTGCCSDTDGDGLDDDEEVVVGRDPLVPPGQVGLFDPASGEWHLRSGDGSITSFFYGNPGDVPLMGDWDCDGIDTVGMFRPSNGFAYLRNTNTFGIGEIEFFFGIAGDIPIVGDWDGDGCDSLGVYRNGHVFLTNTLATSYADIDFWFGTPGDQPFTGDFDSDGLTEIGLFRQTTGYAYLRNDYTSGIAHHDFYFGIGGDHIIAADWNNDTTDTVGIWRPTNTTFYLSNTNTTGYADDTITYGNPTWQPIAYH